MRFCAFEVVDSEVLRVSTSNALEVIAHFDSELRLRHFQGFVATASARGPYRVCVDSLIGSSCSQREVCVVRRFLQDIGMRKAISAFLKIAPSYQFFPGGQPLERFQGFIPFAYLCPPACPFVDDRCFGLDELSWPAAFVLG